jgi:hypothetical protein
MLETTDWEVYGMDMQADRIEDLMGEPRFQFFEGDITINREWIEYHVRKCDTCCRWWRSPRPRPTSSSRCASSSSTSRPTCRSCAPACATASAWCSPRPPRSTACRPTASSIPENSPLVYGPINRQRWIYACSKQLMDRVI